MHHVHNYLSGIYTPMIILSRLYWNGHTLQIDCEYIYWIILHIFFYVYLTVFKLSPSANWYLNHRFYRTSLHFDAIGSHKTHAHMRIQCVQCICLRMHSLIIANISKNSFVTYSHILHLQAHFLVNIRFLNYV